MVPDEEVAFGVELGPARHDLSEGRRGLLAGGLTVQIVYSDRIRDRRRRPLRLPCQDDPTLITTALELRRSLQQRRTAIRFIGVILDRIGVIPEITQQELFPTNAESEPNSAHELETERQRQNWQKILPQVDRIRERHGHGLLLRGSALALQKSSEKQNSNPSTPPIRRDRQGLILRTSCLTR